VDKQGNLRIFVLESRDQGFAERIWTRDDSCWPMFLWDYV